MVVLSIKFLFFLPSSSSTNCVALWNCQQKVMLVLGGVHSIFTFARAFSFAYGGLRAAHQMHDVLLQKVMSAPITFFERNPRGRILNRWRFSKTHVFYSTLQQRSTIGKFESSHCWEGPSELEFLYSLIICRFSSDQFSVDDSLPFIANTLLAHVYLLMGLSLVIFYVQVIISKPSNFFIINHWLI